MRGQVQTSPDDIDITSIWSAVVRKAPRLLIWVLGIGVVTFGGLSLLTPRYASEAQILVSEDDSAVARPKGVERTETVGRLDREAVVSQVQIIKSRDLSLRVIQDLKLASNPDFNSALRQHTLADGLLSMLGLAAPSRALTEQDLIVTAFNRGLQVYNVKDSRVIAIEYQGPTPRLAADIANALADSYLAWQKAEAVKQNDNASRWLGDDIKKLQVEVREAEALVERFRADKSLVATASKDVTLNTQQISDINAQLAKAKAEKSEAEARAKLIREMLGRSSGAVDAAPDVIKSTLIQRLIEQRVRVERQISELSATLLPAHPRMKQLHSELAGVNQQIRGEVRKVVESLENEAKIAGAREASLKASLDELVGKQASGADDEVKLKSLERDAKAKRELLESRQAAFGEAATRRTNLAVPAYARIMQKAHPASVPVFPKKLPLTMLAMAASLLVGFALIVTRELIVGARAGRPAQPLAGRHDGAALGDRPLAGGEAGPSPRAPVLPVALPPRAAPAPVHASIAGVGGELITRAQSDPGYRTLVTGEVAGLDVVEEATELARQLVSAGRQVVLIEWGAGQRGLAAGLGLAAAPGLAEHLAGGVPLDSVVQSGPGGDLHVIAAGQQPLPAAAGLADRLNAAFDTLDGSFDHIIVAGERARAGELFAAMQGRFDAGVLVAQDRRGFREDGEGRFLGYQVPELAVLRYERPTDRGRAARSQPASGAEAASA